MEKYFVLHCDRRGSTAKGEDVCGALSCMFVYLFLPNHKLAGCYSLVIANRNIKAPVIYVLLTVLQNPF